MKYNWTTRAHNFQITVDMARSFHLKNNDKLQPEISQSYHRFYQYFFHYYIKHGR